MEEKFVRLDQFKPRWRFVMSVVELVNLVKSFLLILGNHSRLSCTSYGKPKPIAIYIGLLFRLKEPQYRIIREGFL